MRICCVCTGNTCRSPMLAALLARALHERGLEHVQVESAGIAAGRGAPPSEEAVACMRERGLDIGDHRSRPLAELELAAIERFLCLGPQHAAVLQEAGVPAERIRILQDAQGGVPDPIGGGPEIYRRCAAVLEQEARSLADDLKIDAETSGRG